MGPTAGQIEQQIAGTRDDIESRIVELRGRSQRTVERSKRALLIAVGAGVAIGTAAGIAFVAWRLTRPATVEERVGRVVPLRSVREARRRAELWLRRGVPPVRLYVGDRQVGEEQPETTAQKLVVMAARAAGTAAAAALAGRILGGGKKAA